MLPFFEKVVHDEFLREFWVQIVPNHFRSTELIPLIATHLFHEEDTH